MLPEAAATISKCRCSLRERNRSRTVAGLVRVRKFTEKVKPKSHDFGYEPRRDATFFQITVNGNPRAWRFRRMRCGLALRLINSLFSC